MEYVVIDENGIELESGYTVESGVEFFGNEVEPDTLQNWLSYGRVVRIGDELPEPVAESLEDVEEDSEE